MLIAVGIGIAAVFSVKYNVDSRTFGEYVVVVVLGIYLLASGTLRTLYLAAIEWFNKGRTKDEELD